VDIAEDFQEGTAAKALLAAQVGDQAVILYSDTDSSYPLNMGYFHGVWHGMVKLSAEPVGERLDLGKINIRPGKSAEALLADFAKRTSAGHAVRPVPKCWNSWDYYHSSISHENVIENARAIAADPVLKENIDCVVMDMGWEVRFGEWTADPNFPDGMEATAKAIRDLGFEAGLWFAPVILDPECNFVQDDYDWVGKNRFGFPDRTYECCGLFGYILDVTRPEGEEYLFNLFRHYKEIGYTYFKLDFLRYAMYVHRYADASMTNVDVMRKSLKIIRDAVGDDAYILGCNLPFEVGPGYCDGCRVSGDVSIFWDSVKRNAHSICCTSFWNGRWWANDPDFLVVRGRDTYTGKRLPYNLWWFPRDDEMADNKELVDIYAKRHNLDSTLALEEARTHASMELLNGGAFVLADPVMYLNEAGKEIIRKVLSAKAAPGRPVDIFADNGLSRVWVQKLDDRLRIGLFNWNDTDETVELADEIGGFNIAGKSMADFWTGEGISSGGRTFKLQPHTCRVLEVMD
jgi:alpha-galactosidase